MALLTKLKNFFFSKKIEIHNNKLFVKKKFNTKKIILVEFNNFCISHIIYSYFLDILKNKFKANIIAYDGQVLLTHEFQLSILKKINIFISKFLKLNFFGVYKSFDVKNFYFPEKKNVNHLLLKSNLSRFNKEVKNLKDLEKFKISNILIGDLLYDTYLKSNYELIPTINLKDEKFKNFVQDFISLFLVWENFFKKNKVKAIISSHCVYSLGIPIRIGSKYNIDNFVINAESIFRIKKNFLFQYYEVQYFKKIFNNLNKISQKFLIKKASEKIKNKIQGKYSSDYPYVTKSPFGTRKKNIKINKKDKNVFVIATHDFVDAPHAMGNSLFTDFYQWFKFLCELSKKTNDIWLVKTHPLFDGEYKRYIDFERKVVENICNNFPNIKILPQNITHQQIVKMGVDAVLTVNGTIGVDYPILGVPVINASKFNPHINYKFNIHPKSIKQLEKIILDFKKIKNKFKINRREVYEYYAMRNVFFSKNCFFKDLDELIENVGNYHAIFRPTFYDYWVKNFEFYKTDMEKAKINIHNYIKKNDIFLLNNNIGKF